MSAWIVSNGHIDVLVNAILEYGVVAPTSDARELGQQLWHENHLSVNYRYDEDTPTPPYVLATTEAPIDPDATIYAAGCYDYQSCEHPGWDESESRRLVTALIAAARQRGGKDSPYGTWPWGFESVDQAVAAPAIRP